MLNHKNSKKKNPFFILVDYFLNYHGKNIANILPRYGMLFNGFNKKGVL